MMPGLGTQTGAYNMLQSPGAVGSRGGVLYEPAVDIFPAK